MERGYLSTSVRRSSSIFGVVADAGGRVHHTVAGHNHNYYYSARPPADSVVVAEPMWRDNKACRIEIRMKLSLKEILRTKTGILIVQGLHRPLTIS